MENPTPMPPPCRHPGCAEPIARGSYCAEHAERFYVKHSEPLTKDKRRVVVLKKHGAFASVPLKSD